MDVSEEISASVFNLEDRGNSFIRKTLNSTRLPAAFTFRLFLPKVDKFLPSHPVPYHPVQHLSRPFYLFQALVSTLREAILSAYLPPKSFFDSQHRLDM